MIKAVIFDLDDTLISERQYIESGYCHIAKLLSKKLDKDEKEIYEQLIKLFNKSSKNVFNRLLDNLGVSYSQNTIIELVEEYRNHLPDIKFFDDVIPCLQQLKDKNFKLGLITDGYASAQRKKLEAVKAYNYFDEIIITDELGREYWKPHPKAFEIIKEKFTVEFNEMVYVGDNPVKDFYISAIYPITTIKINRKSSVYRNTSYYKGITEKEKINSLSELTLKLL